MSGEGSREGFRPDHSNTTDESFFLVMMASTSLSHGRLNPEVNSSFRTCLGATYQEMGQSNKIMLTRLLWCMKCITSQLSWSISLLIKALASGIV